MIFFLRKSQLPLFSMPVHVAGGYRKDGTYVKPHMRTAHVAMKLHEQGHLFGAPPAAPAAAKKSPKFDKFLAKHGGEARMRSILMDMTPEQRGKLVDAMAHLDGVEHDLVVNKLGMNEREKKPEIQQPALFQAEDMPDHAEKKERSEKIEALRNRVGKFASGMSRARDFGAAGHAGHSVGVDVGQLSGDAMNDLAEMIAVKHTPVFVDSGAYSLFRKQIADAAAGKDVKPLDFGQILARYDRLAELIHEKNEVEEHLPAPLVSMPDVIGNQQGSLDLIAEHAAWIKATAQFNTLRLLVPFPRGDKSLTEYYDAVVKAAGTDNFVVGIPTVANPWSPAEVSDFLRNRKPRAVHFLGSLHDTRLTKWIEATVDSGVSDHVEVTADANPLRSMILPRDGSKLAPGERAEKIDDKLGAGARAKELENVIAQYGGHDKVRAMLAAADFEKQQRFIGMVSDLSGKPQKDIRAEYGLPDGPVEGDTKVENGVEYVLRNGRWRRANLDAPAQEQQGAADIPGNERLLLVACGDKKKDGAHPAGELYTGALGAVLTKWIPRGEQRPDLHIISAKHGLVHGDTVIDAYNQRMTPERAQELAAQGVDLSQFKGKQYRDVFVAGGADYREVADSYVKQLKDAGVIAQGATVNATHGGIGEIRGQLGEYLRSIGGDAADDIKDPNGKGGLITEQQLRDRARQETEKQAPVVDEKPAHEIVEHTTGKGKVLRGVVRTDLDQDGAKAIDPYTFKKNGGWFIREKHLDGAAPASPRVMFTKPAENPAVVVATPVVDKSKEQAAKLRAGGEKLKADAEADLGRDRNTNTARRVRMAAGAEAQASQKLAIAGTMLNLADAIESGEAKHLKGISTRAAVESLDSSVRSAMSEADRGLSYQQQLERKGRAPAPDDIRNAKIYRPSWGTGGANKSQLIEKLQGKRGARPLIERLRASDGPDGEMVKDLKKYLDEKDISYGLGWWNVEQVKKVDRLARLGITNDHELRLALTEYLVFRDGARKVDSIKAAERALVGQKVGIDFFPTPKPLAAKMAELAGVKPGMSVLEPSAGNGHLADAARDAGATVDAVEISSQLKDVLRAKGHNIVDDDFETFEPGKQYDAVIMNPPFSDRKDAAHIMRAFDMLKPGGKLVAIAGEGVFFGSDQRATAFRSWLDEHGADVEKLPENTFKGSDLPAQTGANARLIVIEKPAGAAAAVAPTEKPMRNFGWDAVKLADAYSMDELHKLRAQVEAEHANPFDEKNRYTENGKSTLHLYDQKGMKKLQALSWAVTYKLQEKRAAAEAAPKDGDRNADGLVFHDGRWHREEEPAAVEQAAPVETPVPAAEPVAEPAADPAMPAASNPDVELAEDREDLADELARDPHSEKAKQLVRRVAERVTAREEPEDIDNPNSPNYRYADTGHIAGSRKEEAAATVITRAKKDGARVFDTAIDWEALEQNPREAKDLITKSNLFGTVDWAALRTGGMEPGAGFLVDRIYAAIGQEPSAETSQARRDYAIGLQSLRDRLEACKTPAEVTGVLDNLRDEFDGTMLTAEESARYEELGEQSRALFDESRAIDEANDVLYKEHINARSALSAIEYEAEKRQRRGWAPKLEHAAELAKLKPISEASHHAWGEALRANRPRRDELDSQRKELGGKREVIKLLAKVRNQTENPMHRAWNLMGDRFIGVIRYRSYKGSDAFANHVAAAKMGKLDWSWMEKETTRAPRVSKESARFQLQIADSSERIGGRTVAPQSTAELKEHFNLRDVQSGNWVLRDVASAKFHTEQCAGAFADLADLLGAEDAQVSLNGRLAMAFGARGHGAKGWAEGAARAHYEPVQRVINLTKMGGGGALAHEWFHGLDNMAKEAEGQGAAGKDDFITENPDMLPAGELRDAVINLRKAMLEGPHYATVVEKYSARDYQMAKHNIDGVTFASSFATKIKTAANVHDAVKAVEALGMAGVRGKPTPKQVKRIRDWRNIAIAYHGGNPAGGEVAVRAGQPMSSFALEARILDQGSKDYWAATHEMSARAFQSWVEDRLADQGRRNDYLSSFADNRHHVDPLTGMQWKPYPEGEERTRINEAFDRLVAAVKKSDTLAKALEMV